MHNMWETNMCKAISASAFLKGGVTSIKRTVRLAAFKDHALAPENSDTSPSFCRVT